MIFVTHRIGFWIYFGTKISSKFQQNKSFWQFFTNQKVRHVYFSEIKVLLKQYLKKELGIIYFSFGYRTASKLRKCFCFLMKSLNFALSFQKRTTITNQYWSLNVYSQNSVIKCNFKEIETQKKHVVCKFNWLIFV